MRRIAWVMAGAGLLWASSAGSALAEDSCGVMPIPEPGCWVGRCIDGEWEVFCPLQDDLSCGVKPIPNFGCYIGGCRNGTWEQICEDPAAVECGPKPLPPVGCRLGKCVEGYWEQICNEPLPMPTPD